MPRETAFERARRLVSEGRLRLTSVHGGHVTATCRGDSASLYRVRHVPGAGWACNCPARSRCGHIIACQLVVIVTDRSADG